MIAPEDIAAAVTEVIAQTFFVDPLQVTRATKAADIDGWDSLSHTVLMIRLEKRLGMPISDRIAAKAADVGELIDMLSAEAAETRP
jgi:acyl carrier protein